MSGLGKGTGLVKLGWGKAMGWSELEVYRAFRLEWGLRIIGTPGRYLHTVHIRNKQVGYRKLHRKIHREMRPMDQTSLGRFVPDRCVPTMGAHRRRVITTAARRNLRNLGFLESLT